MLDSFTFSDSLQRDLEADRQLAESFTFNESLAAGRGGWLTRSLRDAFVFAENLTATGEGVEFGEVVAAVKKLIRIGKEYCKRASQWCRSYGGAVPTDSDALSRSGDDFTKRYE